MDSEALEALYGKMTERALLDVVRRAAGLHGWMTYHTHDSRRSEAGFPDLVLVRPASYPGVSARLLFRELKKQKGRLTPEQNLWLDNLRSAGADVGVWRPFDWGSGKIEEELAQWK